MTTHTRTRLTDGRYDIAYWGPNYICRTTLPGLSQLDVRTDRYTSKTHDLAPTTNLRLSMTTDARPWRTDGRYRIDHWGPNYICRTTIPGPSLFGVRADRLTAITPDLALTTSLRLDITTDVRHWRTDGRYRTDHWGANYICRTTNPGPSLFGVRTGHFKIFSSRSKLVRSLWLGKLVGHTFWE